MHERGDELEEEVKKAIRKVGADCESEGGGVWTATLKAYLLRLGGSLKYTTCGTRCDCPEWLFDLCWYEGPDDCFTSFPLALESEWKNLRDDNLENYYQNIRYDFQKLILARADHRVMVFEQVYQAEFEDVVSRLVKCVPLFKGTLKGDRYLFACWLGGSKEFVFQHYIVGE